MKGNHSGRVALPGYIQNSPVDLWESGIDERTLDAKAILKQRDGSARTTTE